MNFNLSEDQCQLRDGIRRFMNDRYDFEARRRRLESAEGTDRDMWTHFAEMGWLAVLVPEHLGGLGWTMTDATIVAQEFGRALVAEPFLEAGVFSTRILSLCDTPSGDALLTSIASGEALVTVALLETGSRYDVTLIGTRAAARADTLTLNGRKVLVAGGDTADHLVISATTDEGPVLIAVPADSPGLIRTSYRGLDGGWLCDIELEDVTVPATARLAGGNKVLEILTRAMDDAALGGGAEAVGCMDRILELTSEHLRTRQQFDQALADFQVIQHRMADLFVEVEMARSALHSGLSQLEASPDRRAVAVSAARVRIDQAARIVGNQGVHLHGGMGMTIEYPVGHLLRRLMVLSRVFGDTQQHLERYQGLGAKAA